MTALNAEPPVYVDEAAGIIGPVALDLPPQLAFLLLSSPTIPRDQLAEVSRRLGERLPERHHGLLPSTPAPAVEIDEDPLPVLRLKLGRSTPSPYYYDRREKSGPVAVAPSVSAMARSRPTDWTGRTVGSVSIQIRSMWSSDASRKRRLCANALPTSVLSTRGPSNPNIDFSHVNDLAMAKPKDWLEFLNFRAAELQAEGFEIRIDDNFPYHLAKVVGGHRR